MIVLLVQIIILIFLLYIIYVLLYSILRGAPYAPLGEKRINTVFELLKPKKGESFADIGSGDGRVVIFAAKKGMKATGYEINPFLYLISNYKIRKNKIKNAKINLQDFWKTDLSKFKYLSIYGITFIMPGLEKKLLKELKPGAKVATNHFKFPNWKYDKKLNDVYLYIVKSQTTKS